MESARGFLECARRRIISFESQMTALVKLAAVKRTYAVTGAKYTSESAGNELVRRAQVDKYKINGDIEKLLRESDHQKLHVTISIGDLI